MPYGPVTAARAAAYPLSAAPALCTLRENGLGAKDICQNAQAGACGDAAAIFPGAPSDQPSGQAACPCIIMSCNGSIVSWGQKRRFDCLKIASDLLRSPDDFTVRRHVSNAPKRRREGLDGANHVDPV